MSGQGRAHVGFAALLVALAGFAPLASRAHDFSVTDAVALFKVDGTYQIDLRVDLDALALGVDPTTDSAAVVAEIESLSAAEFEGVLAGLEQTILRRVRVRFDGKEVVPLVTFPDLGTPLAEKAGVPSVLGTTARLAGHVPAGTASFTFGASRAFGPVQLTVLDQTALGGARWALGAGEDGPPYALGRAPAVAGRGDVALRYLVLGFEHILPLGLDHILFVLGLFLLSVELRPLLWQVTAFTVAHSITLGLAMYGWVALPSRLVETLIAVSIAYVGIENLTTSRLKPWRPALVFAFGLLHGLGFAGVLHELGLPEGEFVTALITFNLGVELGQLAVVGIAFAAVGWFRARSWYRAAVVYPASALIAAAGLYWSVSRAVG